MVMNRSPFPYSMDHFRTEVSRNSQRILGGRPSTEKDIAGFQARKGEDGLPRDGFHLVNDSHSNLRTRCLQKRKELPKDPRRNRNTVKAIPS